MCRPAARGAAIQEPRLSYGEAWPVRNVNRIRGKRPATGRTIGRIAARAILPSLQGEWTGSREARPQVSGTERIRNSPTAPPSARGRDPGGCRPRSASRRPACSSTRRQCGFQAVLRQRERVNFPAENRAAEPLTGLHEASVGFRLCRPARGQASHPRGAPRRPVARAGANAASRRDDTSPDRQPESAGLNPRTPSGVRGAGYGRRGVRAVARRPVSGRGRRPGGALRSGAGRPHRGAGRRGHWNALDWSGQARSMWPGSFGNARRAAGSFLRPRGPRTRARREPARGNDPQLGGPIPLP